MTPRFLILCLVSCLTACIAQSESRIGAHGEENAVNVQLAGYGSNPVVDIAGFPEDQVRIKKHFRSKRGIYWKIRICVQQIIYRRSIFPHCQLEASVDAGHLFDSLIKALLNQTLLLKHAVLVI